TDVLRAERLDWSRHRSDGAEQSATQRAITPRPPGRYRHDYRANDGGRGESASNCYGSSASNRARERMDNRWRRQLGSLRVISLQEGTVPGLAHLALRSLH